MEEIVMTCKLRYCEDCQYQEECPFYKTAPPDPIWPHIAIIPFLIIGGTMAIYGLIQASGGAV